MLRDHSFRKANISLGFAFLAMVICMIVFGRDASETESQVVAAIIFGTMLVTLFAQYHLEYRRERRSDHKSDDNHIAG